MAYVLSPLSLVMKPYGMQLEKCYNNWDTQFPLIPESLMWYRTNNLIYYLHHLRHYIMDNEHSFPILLHYPIPATEYCRFPDDTSYMCEGIGDWNMHLDFILLCVNILKKVKCIEDSHFKTFGEVEMVILEKINVLLQSVTQEDNLMTRARFEEMYKLVWVEYFVFDYKSMPVVITRTLHRMDKLWQIVARYK